VDSTYQTRHEEIRPYASSADDFAVAVWLCAKRQDGIVLPDGRQALQPTISNVQGQVTKAVNPLRPIQHLATNLGRSRVKRISVSGWVA
jgi:hypothetical protein